MYIVYVICIYKYFYYYFRYILHYHTILFQFLHSPFSLYAYAMSVKINLHQNRILFLDPVFYLVRRTDVSFRSFYSQGLFGMYERCIDVKCTGVGQRQPILVFVSLSVDVVDAI